MNILIIGCNGYIGKTLTIFLKKHHNITATTRNNFDLENFQETRNWFDGKYFDVVINTAVVGGSRLKNDDNEIVHQNLKMHHNLMSNTDHFSKVISFGSGAEIFAHNTPYGMSKKLISESLTSHPKGFNIRIFGVFDENELETRFIKSNIIRYIKKEPMIIHTNKIMDFFYMKDLISLVNYYATNENPPKETNCSYEEKYTLKNIANMINNLDDHKVPIETINKKELEFYCGEATEIPVKLIGLQKGIEEVYRKILN